MVCKYFLKKKIFLARDKRKNITTNAVKYFHGEQIFFAEKKEKYF